MSLQGILSIVGASLRFALPCFIVWLIIRYVFGYKKKKSYGLQEEIIMNILVFYILTLIGVTVYRYGVDWSQLGDLEGRMNLLNLVPLKGTFWLARNGIGWHLIYNVVGNIGWFIPLGFLVPLVSSKKSKWLSIAFLGFCLSTTIEAFQFILMTGIVDVDDILFNTVGALVGYWVYLFVKWLYKRY